METEEPRGPGRGFLVMLGIAGILVGGLVAAALVVPIQPPLGSSCTPNCGAPTGAQIVMPAGVGSNTKLNFSPASAVVVIGVNNTVTFTNEDTVVHTVTASDKSFDSGDIKAGASWNYTFTKPGNYSYYCIYHSSWMRGSITVKGSGAGAGVQVIMPAGVGSNVNQNYDPPTIVVVIGVNNTVTFVNKDGAPHTVSATDGSFDSGNLAAGASWTHTFATAGTYTYYCAYHRWMKGTVTVKAAA